MNTLASDTMLKQQLGLSDQDIWRMDKMRLLLNGGQSREEFIRYAVKELIDTLAANPDRIDLKPALTLGPTAKP